MAESSNSQRGRGAAPPLDYQIDIVKSIVVCVTEIDSRGVSYRIREIWRSSERPLKAGESFRLDTAVHELLGYRPRDRADVVLFFLNEDVPLKDPLEVLPVHDGGIIYSPHDRSVLEKLTLEKLKERVARRNMPKDGTKIPLRISFIGLKAAPAIALAHNNFWPLLVLFENHLVQRAVFRKAKKYSQIEYVDVSVTDTENLDIAYADSWFTFSCKLHSKKDLIKVLEFFDRKGVKLTVRAKQFMSEADPGRESSGAVSF